MPYSTVSIRITDHSCRWPNQTHPTIKLGKLKILRFWNIAYPVPSYISLPSVLAQRHTNTGSHFRLPSCRAITESVRPSFDAPFRLIFFAFVGKVAYLVYARCCMSSLPGRAERNTLLVHELLVLP